MPIGQLQRQDKYKETTNKKKIKIRANPGPQWRKNKALH
jgi:hypothetical protein